MYVQTLHLLCVCGVLSVAMSHCVVLSATGLQEPDESHFTNTAGVTSFCRHEPVDDKLCTPVGPPVDDFC